jgi:N-methylhydantoinase A
VAEPLDLDVEAAAAGMYRVINTNMAHGVREITVKRGLDPREFPLVVAGGAGGLHACRIADELAMPKLIVPDTASVLCAAGMLVSDLQHDFVRSYVCRFGDLDLERLQQLVTSMCHEGRGQLEREGIEPAQMAFQVSLDLRYVKQYHEVTVPVAPEVIETGDLVAIQGALHTAHNRLYGYDLSAEGTELELINVRVRALGHTRKPELPERKVGGTDPEAALKGVRRAFVPETDSFAEVPVLDGHGLLAGNVVEGPALIERTDTTIFVSQAFVAEVDRYGSCVLTRRQG